jgi:tagatose 1,6-diphosphate aldolase
MTMLSAGKFWGLRRLANEDGHFTMLAVDQRPPIKQIVSDRRGESTPRFEDIRNVKKTMMEMLAPHASAVLADPTYALTDAMNTLQPHHGLVVTLEDSLFTETDDGRISKAIDGWSVEKIKRVGGDAVKILTWYRPDQSEATRSAQKDFTKRVGEACAEHDIPFLLEFLVYPFKGDQNHTTDYVEQQGKRADHVIQTVEEFSGPEFGVDIFKLESPIPAADVPAPGGNSDAVAQCQKYFDELGKASGRPWVMLSAGATKPAFKNVMHYAYQAGASGFLAGRAIWWDDFQAFPDLEAMRKGMVANAVPYMNDLTTMTSSNATRWNEHSFYDGDPGPSGSEEQNFAKWYGGNS